MRKKDLINEVIDTDTLVLIDRNNDGDDQPTLDYNVKSNKTTDDQFDMTNDATDSRYIYSLAYFKSAPRDMYESIEKYTESLVEKIIDKNDISDESKDILSKIKSDLIKDKIYKLIKTVKYHDFGNIDKFNIIFFIINNINIPNSEEIIEVIKKETKYDEAIKDYKSKLNEENTRLANKKFTLSDDFLKKVQTNLKRLTSEHSGYEFLSNLLKDKKISYENIKRKIHNYKNDKNFQKSIDNEIIAYLEKLLKFLRQNSNNIKKVKDELRNIFGIEKISQKDIELSESKKKKKRHKSNSITGYFPVRGLHYLYQDHDEEGDAGNFTADVALGIDGGGIGESENKMLNEKSVSKKQQKLMGLAYAYKQGDIPEGKVSKTVKNIADNMSMKELKKFASTKHDKLPEKVEEDNMISSNEPNIMTVDEFKKITEELEDHIPEHSFDIEEFKRLKSFKKRVDMLRYANFIRRISSGSARIAYDIGNGKVLKLAYNKKGILQNEFEIDSYYNSKSLNREDILAKIYDYDENYNWLIMEKVKPVRISYFREKTGIQKLDDLYKYLYSEVNYRGRNTYEVPEYLYNNDFAIELRDLLQDLGIIEALGDFARLSTYGINSKGDIVLTDYGLSDEIFTKHYKLREDKIKGGLADKKKESDFNEEQIKLGVKVEMEHTDNPNLAKEIAMDHLVEDPLYYSKLLKSGL